jgi:hypothetical protein
MTGNGAEEIQGRPGHGCMPGTTESSGPGPRPSQRGKAAETQLKILESCRDKLISIVQPWQMELAKD